MKSIIVKITDRSDEGDDICDDLMLIDAQVTPSGYEWEVIRDTLNVVQVESLKQ